MISKKVVRVTYKGNQKELALLIAEVPEPTVVLVDGQGERFTVEASRIADATPEERKQYWQQRRQKRASCR